MWRAGSVQYKHTLCGEPAKLWIYKIQICTFQYYSLNILIHYECFEPIGRIVFSRKKEN